MSKRNQTWDSYKEEVETEILSQSVFKPLVWKRYIDVIFSLWTTNRDRIEHFIEQANNHYPTIKSTAEISDKETTFLDTCIYKGERFERNAILDVRTHFKPTETFQYTDFTSCQPQGVKEGFKRGGPPTSQNKLFPNNIRRENYKFQSASATERLPRGSKLTQPSQR